MKSDQSLTDAQKSFARVCAGIEANQDDTDLLQEAVEWLQNDLDRALSNDWVELAESIRQEIRQTESRISSRIGAIHQPKRPVAAEKLRQVCLGKKMAKLGFKPTMRGWTTLSKIGKVAIWGIIEDLSIEAYYRESTLESGFVIAKGRRSFGRGGEILLQLEFESNKTNSPWQVEYTAEVLENQQVQGIAALLVKPFGLTAEQVLTNQYSI